LRLPDEAGQQQQDVVPTFSPRSTVYSELVLENLLATIRDEHARYVGVVATDVEDLIFLVHEIRAHCPDVVVFTTSSDLLFTHSDFASDLVGMLVFSTFPLFNLNQSPSWTNAAEAAGARLQFPSEDTEGTYNATLAQLDRPEWIIDYGRPFGGRTDDTVGPVDPLGVPYPENLAAEPVSPVVWIQRGRTRRSVAAQLRNTDCADAKCFAARRAPSGRQPRPWNATQRQQAKARQKETRDLEHEMGRSIQVEAAAQTGHAERQKHFASAQSVFEVERPQTAASDHADPDDGRNRLSGQDSPDKAPQADRPPRPYHRAPTNGRP